MTFARRLTTATVAIVATAVMAPQAMAAHGTAASTTGSLSVVAQVGNAITFARVATAAAPATPVASVTLSDAPGGSAGNATADHVVVASTATAAWDLKAKMSSDLDDGGTALVKSAIEMQGPIQLAVPEWAPMATSDVTLESGISGGTSGGFKLRLNAPGGQVAGDYTGTITFTLSIP